MVYTLYILHNIRSLEMHLQRQLNCKIIKKPS